MTNYSKTFDIRSMEQMALRKSQIRSSHADRRYLLVPTNFDNTPQNILRLHLDDLSAQFCYQLKMIQQITLTGQINPVHTLPRSLHIESNKSCIISCCQTCRLPDNPPGCFLMTTDTSHELLMPDSDRNTHHNLILHLLLHPERHFLQEPVPAVEGYSRSGRNYPVLSESFPDGISFLLSDAMISSSAVKSIFTTSSAS